MFKILLFVFKYYDIFALDNFAFVEINEIADFITDENIWFWNNYPLYTVHIRLTQVAECLNLCLARFCLVVVEHSYVNNNTIKMHKKNHPKKCVCKRTVKCLLRQCLWPFYVGFNQILWKLDDSQSSYSYKFYWIESIQNVRLSRSNLFVFFLPLKNFLHSLFIIHIVASVQKSALRNFWTKSAA